MKVLQSRFIFHNEVFKVSPRDPVGHVLERLNVVGSTGAQVYWRVTSSGRRL